MFPKSCIFNEFIVAKVGIFYYKLHIFVFGARKYFAFMFIMKIHKILISAVFCLALATFSFAQSAGETSADEKDLRTARLLDAVSLYTDGQFASAAERFRALKEEDPTDDAVMYYLGLCESYLGNMDKAEENLLGAHLADTANEWYVSALTSLYAATRNSTMMATYGEKLLRMNPGMYNTPYLNTLVADLKLRQGRDSLAVQYYDRALELDPAFESAWLGKMETYRLTKNYAAFFQVARSYVSNSGFERESKAQYLTSLMEAMDQEFYWVAGSRLESLIDCYLSLYPADSEVRMLKVSFKYIVEDYDGILSQCDTMYSAALASQDKEGMVKALTIKGDVYNAIGDEKKSIKAYSQVLKLDEDNASVLNNYAYILCEQGRQLGKALKMSTRAVELEGDNATFLDTLGWILHLMGRDEQAKPHFKRAMIYGGKESEVILGHYASVLEKLGETELAQYYRMLEKQKKGK